MLFEIIGIHHNTADFLSRIGKEPVWDETSGQNYLEWESGSKLHQIWLEDSQSIQAKLNAMSNYKIGGVAVAPGLRNPGGLGAVKTIYGAIGIRTKEMGKDDSLLGFCSKQTGKYHMLKHNRF